MSTERRNRISVTGIFKPGLVGVDANTSKLVDPSRLAESIGISENYSVKARITLEVVEGACEFCGESATGYQICQNCGKLVCDRCAKKDSGKRYCPKCFEKIQSLSKLV